MEEDLPINAVWTLFYPSVLGVMLVITLLVQTVGWISTTKDITAIIQSIATTLGLLAAGLFAYFKWDWSANVRTRYPTLELTMNSTRTTIGQYDAAICTLSLKNCGNVDALLHERGTGIGIDFASISADGTASWLPGHVMPTILANIAISPQDTGDDEIVILLDHQQDVVRLQTRVVWNWADDAERNYQKVSAQILRPLPPPPTTLSATVEQGKGERR